MNEILQTGLAFLRGLLRFRWPALALAFLISLAGWSFVHQLDDVYRSSARIFVDSNRVLGPLLKGIAIQADVAQRVSLMSRTLLSRPNLEKLVRSTDLDVEAVTEYDRERLLDSVRERIGLNGTRGNSSIYTISYRDSERERAKRVVQALITIFIEDTLGDKRRDSESAQQFLDQQILSLEQRLANSERRLSDFKRENAGKMPGESGGYYSRLESSVAQARAARLELEETRNRAELLAARVAKERPTLRGEGIGGQSALQLKLEVQRDELTDLLARYTERHPRVSQLRASIEQLETRAAEERAEDRPGSGFSVIASPAYQEMRGLLTEAEARVAELEVRVTAYDSQVEELEQTIESIPRVEAELAQLNRDYQTVGQQYNELLERRESARLSEQVEQNVDDINFRVIDPPFVPTRPNAPRKDLMSAIVLAASLGAGAAGAFALSLLFPVYYTPESVAAHAQRDVLGSVSLQEAGGSRWRSRLSWMCYLMLLGLLVALGGLLFALHADVVDIDRLSSWTGLPLEHWLDLVDQLILDGWARLRGLSGAIS